MVAVAEKRPPDRLTASSIQELSQNGRRRYAWREVDGAPMLVIVELRFTVPARDGESDKEFERRMIGYSVALAELGFPVVSVDVEYRAKQGKTAWALFECRTPAYLLKQVETPTA